MNFSLVHDGDGLHQRQLSRKGYIDSRGRRVFGFPPTYSSFAGDHFGILQVVDQTNPISHVNEYRDDKIVGRQAGIYIQ